MFCIVQELQRIVCISVTRCPMWWSLNQDVALLNEQVVYTEISKLNFADMCLISLKHVTYYIFKGSPKER